MGPRIKGTPQGRPVSLQVQTSSHEAIIGKEMGLAGIRGWRSSCRSRRCPLQTLLSTRTRRHAQLARRQQTSRDDTKTTKKKQKTTKKTCMIHQTHTRAADKHNPRHKQTHICHNTSQDQFNNHIRLKQRGTVKRHPRRMHFTSKQTKNFSFSLSLIFQHEFAKRVMGWCSARSRH